MAETKLTEAALREWEVRAQPGSCDGARTVVRWGGVDSLELDESDAVELRNALCAVTGAGGSTVRETLDSLDQVRAERTEALATLEKLTAELKASSEQRNEARKEVDRLREALVGIAAALWRLSTTPGCSSRS